MKVAKITYEKENATYDVWVTTEGRIAQDRYYIYGGTSQYRYDSASGQGKPEMGDHIASLYWLEDTPESRTYSKLEWVEIDLPEGFDRPPYAGEGDADFSRFFPALRELTKATA